MVPAFFNLAPASNKLPSAFIEQAPAPTKLAPAFFNLAPAPTKLASAFIEQAPAPTNLAPAFLNLAPASSKLPSAFIEQAPAPTNLAPASNSTPHPFLQRIIKQDRTLAINSWAPIPIPCE